MHEPYDDNSSEPHKFYFQIDTEWIQKYINSLISKMNPEWIDYATLDKVLNDSSQYTTPTLPDGFSPISLPVNSWLSSIAEAHSSLYLGNNYYNEGVWKKAHFAKNCLTTEYKQHLNANAVHILQQPNYYKGMFDIQN